MMSRRSSYSVSLLLLLLQCSYIQGFSPVVDRCRSSASSSLFPPLLLSRETKGGVRLQATRRQPTAAANSKKKKNKSKKPKEPKVKSSPKTTAAVSSGPHQQQQQPKKKKVKAPPPWQVLNAKQAKQNVQTEIQRRSSDSPYIPTTERNTNNVVLSKNFLSATHSRLLQWKPFKSSIGSSVEFIAGCLHDKQIPKSMGVPEVAFLGRSNVGKSSLLNQLLSSAYPTLARVGKTPGATASVNVYCIMKQQQPLLGLVDLPGYGYAKLSKQLKDEISTVAESYLTQRTELAVGILLVDIRRTTAMDDDRAILAALYDLGVPVVVVATKRDKVTDTEAEKNLRVIRDTLGLPEGQPLAVSSITGEGCRLLWRIIMDACEDHVGRLNRKYVEDTEEDDDSGMEVDVFDDHDDIVYEQGYDWIHGSSAYVDEEYEAVEALPVDTTGDDDVTKINHKEPTIDMDKMKLQDWHRKSMEMERDGLI